MNQFLSFIEIGTKYFKDINLGNLLDEFKIGVLPFLKDFILAILILVIGKKLIKFFLRIVEKYFQRSRIEISVSGFLLAFIRAILYIILIVYAVSFIGIESNSIVALVGSAGLTLGFALQGSLSNFAGGVLILILKPFRVGDYIIAGINEGTVTSIDIFYTKLLTFDNRLLVMPNGALSNTNIINVSNEPDRRLDINVLIDYSENIQKVKDILIKIAQTNEMVLQDHEINSFVSSFEPSALNIGMRVWVANENYWTLKWKLLEQIRYEFAENKITMPFNQLDVSIRNN